MRCYKNLKIHGKSNWLELLGIQPNIASGQNSLRILFNLDRIFWKCLIFHYLTVCITQKIVLKAKDLIQIYFIIHEGKKHVKFLKVFLTKFTFMSIFCPKSGFFVSFFKKNFHYCEGVWFLIFHYSHRIYSVKKLVFHELSSIARFPLLRLLL